MVCKFEKMWKRYSMERLKSSLRIITFTSLLIISALSSHLYFYILDLLYRFHCSKYFFLFHFWSIFFLRYLRLVTIKFLSFTFWENLLLFLLNQFFLHLRDLSIWCILSFAFYFTKNVHIYFNWAKL